MGAMPGGSPPGGSTTTGGGRGRGGAPCACIAQRRASGRDPSCSTSTRELVAARAASWTKRCARRRRAARSPRPRAAHLRRLPPWTRHVDGLAAPVRPRLRVELDGLALAQGAEPLRADVALRARAAAFQRQWSRDGARVHHGLRPPAALNNAREPCPPSWLPLLGRTLHRSTLRGCGCECCTHTLHASRAASPPGLQASPLPAALPVALVLGQIRSSCADARAEALLPSSASCIVRCRRWRPLMLRGLGWSSGVRIKARASSPRGSRLHAGRTRLVHKDIVSSALGRDEAKAFGRVEPLDSPPEPALPS